MKIFFGNSQRALAARLAEVTSAAPPNPLAPETVLVLSRGMQRWLTLQLAGQLGVCANFEFPFPATIVEKIMRAFVPEMPDPMPFTPEAMTWAVYRELPRLLDEDPQLFSRIVSYLTDDDGRIDELRAYQLSRRIADVFDHYQVYRAAMVLGWETGPLPENPGEAWQAALWRAIGDRWQRMHLAHCHRLFGERIAAADELPPQLPGRISLFGISSLPPLQLKVLAAVSRLAQVNLFINDPCPERRQKRTPGERNRLLESNDTLLQQFVELIESETAGLAVETELLFERPPDGSLLGRTKAEVFEGGRDTAAGRAKAIQADDLSLTVASCHSEMREIEVLHDALLEMFADKTLDLRADEVLVMIPEIELYAPYIRAVFDAPPDGDQARRIPYTIADRSLRAANVSANALFALFDLARGRFTVSGFAGLIESEPVRRRFGLSDDDLSLIRHWLVETGVRWGIDDEDRSASGAGGLKQNSFRFGFDRLLLGYAMPLGGAETFADILPFDDVEGDAVRVLAALLEVFNIVAGARRDFAEKRTPAGWAALGERLVGELFFTGDERAEAEVRQLRQCFAAPARAAEAAGFEGEVGLGVIRSELAALVEGQRIDRGYLEGAVTFCSLVPMRSVPFKAICLVGMNDEAYPRQVQSLGFDLMAAEPQPGDRSRRLDDRFLFLESLMSAERRLYLSYIGQSIEDNSTVAPSVLVSELLDYINAGEGDVKREPVRHRLQPFSPHYFTADADPRLFSYNERLCAAAKLFDKPTPGESRLFDAELDEPPPEYLSPTIERLIDFYSNPARFLLRERLRIDLGDNFLELKDSEDFDFDGLTRYKAEQDILSARLSGADLDRYYAVARATGTMPPEPLGVCRYETSVFGAEQFAEKINAARRGEAREPLELDFSAGSLRLTGKLNGIYGERMVLQRFADRKPKDLLGAWIRHLALNCCSGVDHPKQTLLIAKDKTTLLHEPHDAPAQLAQLLEYYRRGLQKPLPLLPVSSFAYAESQDKNERAGKLSPELAREQAMQKAATEYLGGYNKAGEIEDVYIAYAWRGADPLAEPDFEELARAVFGAALSAAEEV